MTWGFGARACACLVAWAWVCSAWAAEEGLVAHWSFDGQGPGVAHDASGHDHHLTLKNVERVRGAIGSALRFKGGAANVHMPLTDALQPSDQVTVACWARLDALSGGGEGMGVVNADTSYLLRFSGPVPSFHIFTDGWGPVQAGGSVRFGEWYHLVGTYDGEQMRIYVNGQLAAARKREGRIRQTKGTLLLGRQVNPLRGAIDEVKIFRRRLTDEQIAAAFATDKARFNPGVEITGLAEPFEDLFGRTRNRHAPPATLNHLPPADVCFVVITDTHIGQVGEEGRFCHNWRVDETIRQINALGPDFVVHCGDIITTFPFSPAFEDQCRNAVKVLAKFKMPVRLVAGNHDIGNQRNMRVWDRKFLARINNRPLEAMLFKPAFRELYRKYFGDDYYSFEHAGCRFIVFDNQICNSGLPLEKAQMSWLASELQKARTAKASFLFMHNPLFWCRPDESGPKNYEPVLEPARSRILDLLARHPVTAVYAGHTHFAFANSHRGVHLRTINSTTFNRNYAGIEQRMSGEAQIYDPLKLGYLVVRVRGQSVHESWVPLYARDGHPPDGLARLFGPRLIARPATEMPDSLLGITTPPPPPISHDPDGRELVNDHAWRLAEDLGSTWLQTWPPSRSNLDWAALKRGLTVGRPRGVNVAVSLPHDAAEMMITLTELKPHTQAIAAVVVPNGQPANPKAPLTSWRAAGTPSDWAKTCTQAGELAGGAGKVVLARLPLCGDGALDRVREAAGALKGKAHALAVWLTTTSGPEALVERIASAAQIARANGLRLWLDVAAWQRVDEPLRAAYLLRLLAICQAQQVRVFWWIGPGGEAGLLDEHLDRTPLAYAAQSWQAVVDGPTQPVTIRTGDRVRLEWRDRSGRQVVVWWRQADDMTVQPAGESLRLPNDAIVIDPLHGRLLRLKRGDPIPVCPWPLIARGG